MSRVLLDSGTFKIGFIKRGKKVSIIDFLPILKSHFNSGSSLKFFWGVLGSWVSFWRGISRVVKEREKIKPEKN